MFTKDDLAKFRAFRHIVLQGKYEFEGKAAITAATLFDWFLKLEGRLEQAIPLTVSDKEVVKANRKKASANKS